MTCERAYESATPEGFGTSELYALYRTGVIRPRALPRGETFPYWLYLELAEMRGETGDE